MNKEKKVCKEEQEQKEICTSVKKIYNAILFAHVAGIILLSIGLTLLLDRSFNIILFMGFYLLFAGVFLIRSFNLENIERMIKFAKLCGLKLNEKQGGK